MSSCCQKYPDGIGYRNLTLYSCISEIKETRSTSGILRIDQDYAFGGSFTSTKSNPVTNAISCPSDQFRKQEKLDDIQICMAEKIINAESLNLPHFWGIYSCDQGNPVTPSKTKECPAGYSAYVMGVVQGDCILYVCLDFEKLDYNQEFPTIALPPFFSFAIKNQTNHIANDTSVFSAATTKNLAFASLNNNGAKVSLSATILFMAIHHWYSKFFYHEA